MAYNYYLKQQTPICEVRLNQTSAKNPRPIFRVNRFSSNPDTVKNKNDNICQWKQLRSFVKKMNIRTFLLEEYVNIVDTKARQNTNIKIKMNLLVFYYTFVFIFCFI